MNPQTRPQPVESHTEYLRVSEHWEDRRVFAQACFRHERSSWCDETDFDTLVRDLSEPVRAEAEACGVQWRLDAAPELANMRFDRVQLLSVLLEMAHDALHGLTLGQVDARELVAHIGLTPAHQIEICVDLRR